MASPLRKEGEAVSVKAELVLDRKDFGIVYEGKPDDLIKGDVLLKLDLRLADEA